MKRIESVIADARDFLNQSGDKAQDARLVEAFDLLVQRMKEDNKYNVSAQINIGQVAEERFDISDLEYGHHYDVVTGSYRDDDGNEFASMEEARKYYENEFPQEKWKEFFELVKRFEVYENGDEFWEGYDKFTDALEYIMSYSYRFEDSSVTIQPRWYIRDEHGSDAGSDSGYDDEDDAEYAIEELMEEKLESVLDDIEEGGFTPHEVMWNTVYNYGENYVDLELASLCGLAVVDMYDGARAERSQYLALTGCGMDLSPQLVAYQALRFGCVSRGEISRFDHKSNREYFEHVVGKYVADDVYRKLGIYEAIQVTNYAAENGVTSMQAAIHLGYETNEPSWDVVMAEKMKEERGE